MAQVAPSTLISGPSHLPGLTRLTFARDGQTIFTGGEDCILRYHDATSLSSHSTSTISEPGFFDEHRDAITCLSTSPSHLITGSTDSTVRAFDIDPERRDLSGGDGWKFEGNVTRASGVGIRWLSVDPSGEKVAVCSDELLLKIVTIARPTEIVTVHNFAKPPRSCSWHPTNGMLTVVTCDGKILAYELLDTGSASIIKTVDSLIPLTTPDSLLPLSIAWHPSGDYFVVPSRLHEIALVDRDTWTKRSTFSLDGHDAEIGALGWSPNGRYLASSARDGEVIVWETEGRRPLVRTRLPQGGGTDEIITSLEWSPNDNLLAFATTEGNFYTWPDVIPAEHLHPAKSVSGKASKGLNGNGDADMMDGLEDDLDIDGEDLGEEDDWIIDDEENEGGLRKERNREGSVERDWNGAREVVSITKAQPSFQPGSTIMKNKKRYLAFNMIGVVEVSDLDTHHVINVEFHDKSARRGYHFQDHTRFSMAAMGEQGIAFAARTEDGRSSSINYRAYDAWASQSDWQASFPVGEDVVAVAVGGQGASNEDDLADAGMGSVIAATSKGYIRFFSGSGLQRYVWRLGEEVIGLAAGRDQVFLVHREGGTSLDGCQNLRYTTIDLESFEIVQEGRLPLPKKVTLSWIGFSAPGVPVMYDSTGLLSCLDRSRSKGQGRWVPLLDSNTLARKENKTENYWPVGVSDTQMMCIILKGAATEPYFPRPIVLEVDVSMPLLNMDVAQGQMEEKLLRQDLLLSVTRDVAKAEGIEDDRAISTLEVAQDKELLQLVQAACKADKLQRALDLTRLMHNSKTMDAAAKLAGFYHLPGLQDKIAMVKEAIEDKRIAKEAELRSSRRAHPVLPAYGLAPRPALSTRARDIQDFAPRDSGVKRTARPSVATTYDEASYASREDSYVPETPQESLTTDAGPSRRSASPSPNAKRKRAEDIDGSAMSKRAAPAKNPFARKAEVHTNPFAKPASNKIALATKSTSFFERVDDIEQKGKNGGKKNKAKDQGKQTTLFGLPAPSENAKEPTLQRKSGKGVAMMPNEEATNIPTGPPEDHSIEDEEPEQMGADLAASPRAGSATSKSGDPDEPMAIVEEDGRKDPAEDSEGEPLDWDASDDETQI